MEFLQEDKRLADDRDELKKEGEVPLGNSPSFF
jgi:hypothetical protein